MSAAKSTVDKDLVVGLGATGLSIARYLKRNDANAIFFDSREEPPGLEELEEIFPDPELRLGNDKLPIGVSRVIASPGVPDSHPLLKKARKKKVEIVSDIELFAREADKPFVAVTGSNGKSTVTTLLYHMCRATAA
jgi:UDP-N-acetylmuramoylalanine--D-glutamate ligase